MAIRLEFRCDAPGCEAVAYLEVGEDSRGDYAEDGKDSTFWVDTMSAAAPPGWTVMHGIDRCPEHAGDSNTEGERRDA